MAALSRRLFPGMKQGKALYTAYAGKHKITPSGLKAGAASANYFRNPEFLNRSKGPHYQFYVPDEVILCEDISQGIYCHLLCALARAPEILCVFSLFAATLATGARALKTRWREIVEDIRTGTLSELITEPEMRAAVEKTMKPDPHRASQIERECSQDDWEGIFPRLFPNVHYVSCILSGSMKQYAPIIQQFAGRLPVISFGYVSSENGFIAMNVDQLCAVQDIAYMLWPEYAYYEFIPLEDDTSHEQACMKVLEACELEVGKEYEIVLTNYTGFRKTVPVFAFVRRIGVVLSVHVEKTDEEDLQAAVNKASALLRSESSAMELVDYTSTSDVSSSPGRYIIFWEMADSSNLDQGVLQKCADALDASFHSVYKLWRSHAFIGPLELHVVREGTFAKMMDASVRSGTSPSQYKPPRCVYHPQRLEILKAGTTTSFTSTVHFNLQ